jgi:hypothetical protein
MPLRCHKWLFMDWLQANAILRNNYCRNHNFHNNAFHRHAYRIRDYRLRDYRLCDYRLRDYSYHNCTNNYFEDYNCRYTTYYHTKWVYSIYNKTGHARKPILSYLVKWNTLIIYSPPFYTCSMFCSTNLSSPIKMENGKWSIVVTRKHEQLPCIVPCLNNNCGLTIAWILTIECRFRECSCYDVTPRDGTECWALMPFSETI